MIGDVAVQYFSCSLETATFFIETLPSSLDAELMEDRLQVY